jgi:hypothetical protein
MRKLGMAWERFEAASQDSTHWAGVGSDMADAGRQDRLSSIKLWLSNESSRSGVPE